MKKVSVISLGCPKNTIDSEVILGNFSDDQYQIVSNPQDAQVIIVNTCGFVESAKQESINTILQASHLKQNGKLEKLVVSGCLAQRYGEQLKQELPEIDFIVGLNEVETITQAIQHPKPLSLSPQDAAQRTQSFAEAVYINQASSKRKLTTPKHYAYLKISEGCDLPCTFCIIPKIRGHFRSRSLEDIEQEAYHLVQQGVREICLVAQDSTWYGSDRYGQPQIAPLLKRLSKTPSLEWLRLHYLYPSRVTDEFLEAMASSPKICPYFDVPMQHISDRILKRMKRIGNRKLLESMIQRIRKILPQAAIRSTFIVGFPGETEAEFEELMDFLKNFQLDHVGFFPYSQEENTAAFNLPDQVSEKDKADRLAHAYQIQESIAEEAHAKWIGTTVRVVLEEKRGVDERWGRTLYQAPEVDGMILVEKIPDSQRVGSWMNVRISQTLSHDLIGEYADQA